MKIKSSNRSEEKPLFQIS